MQVAERRQISVRLTPEKARKFKSLAAIQGKTVQEIFEIAVDSYLADFNSGNAKETADSISAIEASQRQDGAV